MLENIMKHEVDYMKLLYDDPNVSVYELDAITLGKNDNQLNITKECAEKSLPSFANKPLYGIIDNKWNVLDGENNDFMEHFREEYPERLTRDRILPFGSVPESAVNDARFIERDGKIYLRMNVVVWKRLLPHVSEILKRRDGSVKISVEFVIVSGKQNEETGIIDVEEFNITAITVLGEKFREIMDGCRIKSIKFSYNDFINESNKNYFSFSANTCHEIPKNILDSMKNGISLREKYGRGGNKNTYQLFKSMYETGVVYNSQIEDIRKSLVYNDSVPKESNPPTGKFIMYHMFGGKDGYDWFNSVVCNGITEAIEKNSKGGNHDNKITIDNNKEVAINSNSWENPGKSLYERLMGCENEKELLDEAYLVVENGYKDSPSEHLKYPHHSIKDGKLVVNIAGLKAAFARASQMGIDNGSVEEHLKRHYREMGLNMDNFEQKYAELEEKYNSLNSEYEAKCSKMSEMEAKCAELEAKCSEMSENLAEKCSKLEKFENAERINNNMAALNKYASLFDEETVNALKQCAEEMSCEEMNSKITECVMDFAEKSAKSNTNQEDFKFSYGFAMNSFFNNKNTTSESELSKISKKYKTTVI